MNKTEQLNRYYNTAKSLIDIYTMFNVGQESLEILDLAMKYLNKAQDMKEEFDEEFPEVENDIANIVNEIKKGAEIENG